MKFLRLLPLLVSLSLAAQTPSITQSAVGSAATGAPLTLTLTTSPSVGDMVWSIISYQVYGDYDFLPPDTTWTCTLGGRTLPSAASGLRILTCSHVVASGDPRSYTFTPTGSDAPSGGSGTLFEAQHTVGSQIAYNYIGTGTDQLVTPAVTPSTVGTLPVALSSLMSTPSSGWTKLPSSIVAFGPLTTDTTTPISTTFTGYNYGSSIQETMLLTPGAFAAAPVVSPIAGSYASQQSVSLSTTTSGAVLHYTLDGSTPTCTSPTYTVPLTIAASTRIYSVTCATGFTPTITRSLYVIGAGTLAGIELGANADLHGFVPWANDLWHTDVYSAPVDTNSSTIMSLVQGFAGTLRHDWSSTASIYGIPYQVVDSSTQPLVPWTGSTDINYSSKSDNSLFPIPAGVAIEQRPGLCNHNYGADSHANIIDRRTGIILEVYQAYDCPTDTPRFSATNGALFDMKLPTSVQRPFGFTSADAASLSVFEGLVRYDEILAGVVSHAIRFTLKAVGCYYHQGAYSYFQLPSTAGTPACTGGQAPDANNIINYGMKLRLRANFDISGYSPTNQIILTALKHYGIMLADLSNNNTADIEGSPDPRWNDADLGALDGISLSNFDVVQKGTVYNGANSYPRDPNSAYTGGGAVAPTYVGTPVPHIVSFTATPPTVVAGQCTTLTANVPNSTTLFVDLAGPMNYGSITTCPTQTTTYTLTANGLSLVGDDGFADGVRATSSITVTTSEIVLPAALVSPQGMRGWQGFAP